MRRWRSCFIRMGKKKRNDNMQIDKIITDYVLSKDTDYAIMIDGEGTGGRVPVSQKN